ncbi:MAG: Calx-beta domain-containing protein [Cyanobacteriota bacterium]|nr:Calx-beta domain-containing protein [Cyanobacteriota bacterium]
MPQSLLDNLLRDWRTLLTHWSQTGDLTRAAQEALRLEHVPARLQRIVAGWRAGSFQDLPPVVVMPASAMPAARGAYATRTGTIYLNGDWLSGASRAAALAVLTEELGHHLDALLNASDTPGDEGELFAALLTGGGAIPAEQRQALLAEADPGRLLVGGEELAVEMAARLVSVPVAARYLGNPSTRGEYLNPCAFAALRGNGSVITWGDPTYGGDSTAVAAKLSSGVVQIFSNQQAFAALKSDGSVVTWGYPIAGGEPVVYGFNPGNGRFEVQSSIASRLVSGVKQIFSSSSAFAALKNDGSVVCWGYAASGGSANLSALSSGVTQIISTNNAFAALKNDGSVVTWGGLEYYDNEVAARLSGGVTQIYSNNGAFAALKSDGSVVTWGERASGAYTLWPAELPGLLASGVTGIYPSRNAFAALKSNGSVVAWGQPDYGSFTGALGYIDDLALKVNGSDMSVPGAQSNIISIVSGQMGFVAFRRDGSAIGWGGGADVSYQTISGVYAVLADQLRSGLVQFCASDSAFAALKSDGSVVTWGEPTLGGDSSAVAAKLSSGVSRIFSTQHAFAALKSDGSVVAWGHAPWGGDSSAVAAKLSSGVTQIISNYYSFTALKTDGSVVTWGDPSYGGNSSAIASQLVDVVAFANPFTDDRLLLDAELPAITLAVAPVSVAEDGAANLVYTFTRSGPSADPLTVGYTVGGTASLGTDYTGIAAEGTTKAVTFSAGSPTATVTVDPTPDAIWEPNETVALRLAYGSAYTLATSAAVVGTIRNDDLPAITLAVAPTGGVAEDGSANLVFTFRRNGPTTAGLSVNYTVAGTASLGSDYTGIAAAGTTKTVFFAPGASTATVTVDPTADTTIEPDETVSLRLAAGSGYTLGTTAAVSAILKNDDSRLTLYDAALSGLPSQQGWLAFGSGLAGSQTRSASGTILNSTTLLADAAGYSNRSATAPTPFNSAFPPLDRSLGFGLDFRLRLLSETHQAPNRAGFSLTLLDQGPTPQGIELGFWTNSVFSQAGGSTPFQTINERVDGLNTTLATTYSLRLLDQSYYLLAGSRLLLSGAVQDYSLWPRDPLLPYNPYTTPNFLFLGDNSRSAAALVELGTTSLTVPLSGGPGADRFLGTAAADSFQGQAGADSLSGNGGNDWLAGGAGADSLQGGAGDDFLIGGSEADRFLFGSGAAFLSSQLGVDTLVDFHPVEDRLVLARATFAALPAGSSLAAEAFATVSSDAEAATSAATLVYNSTNGALIYNANGSAAGFAATSSAGGPFAQLWGGANGASFPALSGAAFEIA